MVQHLKDTGVLPEQIIDMNFESFDFHKMSADDVYRYVKERIIAGKRMYLSLTSCSESKHGKMQ